MKSELERQAREIEEKLILLETNKYPLTLGLIMLRDLLNIFVEYSGRDFEKQINRYLMLERKYK